MTKHNTTIAKRRWAPWAIMCALALAGCHQDMWNQPRYTPLQPSVFFADGAASRPIPEGTVEFMQPRTDEHYYQGKIDGEFAAGFPEQVTVDSALLDRGQNRFQIYCAPCHGLTGMGDGMIPQRGFKNPPAYHEDRLKAMPNGYFFDVMTNGFGVMYSYSNRVNVADRWAIVAYIRALQLTQTPADELSDEQQEYVEQGYSPTAPAAEESASQDEH